MEPYTVSSRILTLHRAFASYTSQRLQELGLNFGQMYFILYVGKHPDCTPSELTKELHIQGYAFHGFAAHITDVAGYYASSMRLLDPAVRQDLFCPQRPIYAKENDAASTYMDPQGGCVNSLVDDGCDIQGSVHSSILSRGVRVEKGAVVDGCILFKDTVVGRGAQLRHVIADKDVKVGPGVHLEGTEKYPLVLGKGAEV